MVEYALLLALIALVCVLAVAELGTQTGGFFDDAGDRLDAGGGSGGGGNGRVPGGRVPRR